MNTTFNMTTSKKSAMVSDLVNLGKKAYLNWGDNAGDIRQLGKIYNELKDVANLTSHEKSVVSKAGDLIKLDKENAIAQIEAKSASRATYSKMRELSIAELKKVD